MEKVKATQSAAPPISQSIKMQTAQPAAQPIAHVHHEKKAMCDSHMHRYVEVQTADGTCYDGIVEHVDQEWLCLAVPGSIDQMRAFFPPFYPPYGPYFRPRRFERLVLPLAALTAISLLPYYW